MKKVAALYRNGKCCFCQEKNNEAVDFLKVEEEDSYYLFATYGYHIKCLKEILQSPEQYGDNLVDVALLIANRLELKQQNYTKARALCKRLFA